MDYFKSECIVTISQNYPYFLRFQSRDKVLRTARERKQRYLSEAQGEHHRLWVPRTAENHWSNSSGMYGKDRIPALVVGKLPRGTLTPRRCSAT